MALTHTPLLPPALVKGAAYRNTVELVFSDADADQAFLMPTSAEAKVKAERSFELDTAAAASPNRAATPAYLGAGPNVKRSKGLSSRSGKAQKPAAAGFAEVSVRIGWFVGSA